MQDEYQDREQGDFTTIVNTFTQGLRELPTDYVARVKNFLAEYLGSAHHPVPFGGRSKDFEQLDSWLAAKQEAPYLLLAAPAGRGKSALLLRWCLHLFARRDLAVAYFPVSIRFRTNLAGVVFPALVALLARLHGEKVPSDPNMHEEVWRGLLVDYMHRPLADGRSLVLVLDGIDEAADWAPDLFPLDPPAGLHIVLSARYLANDQDADAWLQRLDWTREGLARTLALYPLDRTGVASVLTQMGFPLDMLSTRINIVSELYRLSEGDPLLVRLYVDDLWERGEAAIRFQPEDLRAIRPGLAGYFERWWKEQRLLWSKEAPQREASAQIVLNLLAGALGPLSKQDILSLAAGKAGLQAEEIEQHIAPLARFVTGDGIRQGYVFSHPRLGNYFLEEQLSELERQEVEQRFLAWGEHTLTALNEGRLAPESASSYIIQYYGVHLERAQASAGSLLTLVSDGWRRAWEKLDRANAGFLGDVERAWRAAGIEDAVATANGELAPYLGEEIRCLLSQVSVNSVTSNISPRLMLEAVKTGIWTPAQGLACIRLITDLVPRAQELVGLAAYVQEPVRTDILQEALDTVTTIKDEYARLDALVELAAGFPEELLWQVLEVVATIEDEADRAGVLAELAPAISPYQALVKHALDFAQDIEEEEYRALALEGLAPCFSEEQHEYVLQLVEMIQEERYRAQTLKAMIPHIGERLLMDILAGTHAMQDGLSRIRLLTDLVTYLPKQLKEEAMQQALELEREIEDREYRVEVLVKLAPFLDEEKVQQALQEIQLLWDESYRVRALGDLIQYLPEDLLPEFQQIVLAMKSEDGRTKVLQQLIPRLSEKLLAQTLDTVQMTWDEGRRAELLAQITPYASEELLPRMQEIASTIEDQGYRVWLLAELEAPVAGKLNGEDSNMPTIFLKIREKEDRLQTLLAIAPRLSERALTKIFDFMLPDVFGFAWGVRSEDSRAHILSKLGSRLPEDWLATAMGAVRAMRNEVYQVQALMALAPRIDKIPLSETLAIVRGMQDREKRAQVLEVLVSSLPEEHKGERVQEMLQVLQIIKDEAERSHIVVASAPYLPATLPSAKAGIMLEAARAMHDENNRARIVKALATRIPKDMFATALSIAQGLHSEEEQALALEALAPYVPENFLPHFLNIAQTLHNARWRTQVLASIVANAPPDVIAGMLATVQDIQNEGKRADMLEALAPHVQEEYFRQLWEAIQDIPERGKRLLALSALAQHMPEDYFPQLWKTVQAITDDGWQLWIVRSLAPHMSESLFAQVWDAVQKVKNSEARGRMLAILIPYMPERFFAQIWNVVKRFPAERQRWQAMEILALHVPEDFFLDFLKVVNTIPDQFSEIIHFQALKALAAHVPERYVPQFFAVVLASPREAIRVQVLEALTPHVSEDYFPVLWEAMQTIHDKRLQTRMLLGLAPHVPTRFLPSVWEAVQAMQDRVAQTQVLRGLLPHLDQERLAEALTMVQPYGEGQIEMLEELLSYLSTEKRMEVLQTLLPLQDGEELAEALVAIAQDKRWHMRALAVLLPHLPPEQALVIMAALLQAIRALRTEEDQVWMLSKLATHLPEALLKEWLEALWSNTIERYHAEELLALLPTLSQSGWAKLLELVMVKMRASGNINFSVQVLRASDPQIHSPALLYPILHETLHLLSQRMRRETAPDLVFLASAIHVAGGQEAIMEVCRATLDVGQWWP